MNTIEKFSMTKRFVTHNKRKAAEDIQEEEVSPDGIRTTGKELVGFNAIFTAEKYKDYKL